jgi:hypothetical protein
LPPEVPEQLRQKMSLNKLKGLWSYTLSYKVKAPVH